MTSAIFVAFGYLLGSLPFAVIVSRAFGLADPRSYGSGNPGATNVLRSGNKLAAVLTLLGDAAKGWLAVWLASQYFAGAATAAVALTGLAAFLGHVFPLFLK
ncbi:MAG: glycerol-3-phosphate acyltransferase, partial [Pseudomonadota bacterium]